MSVVAAAVYIGRPSYLPDGRRSAMLKTAVHGPLLLGAEGLEGDAVADRRVHGGPEQALHQFPAEHHRHWGRAFPDLAEVLVPGSIGENLSTTGMTEANVHVGDVYRWGEAEIEVSQPRMPCIKINARFGNEHLAEAIMAAGRCGWYYRVRRSGRVAAGQALDLLTRPANSLSLAEIWEVQNGHPVPLPQLERAAAAPGLAPKWRRRFAQRLQWLREHGAEP